MARKALRSIALLARRHYPAIFVVGLVMLALSIGAASRLRFDTDVLNLLPRHAPEVQTLRGALDDFGSVDLLVLVVRLPAEVPLAPYEAFVDQVGHRLQGLDELLQVDFKLGEIEELLATFMPQAFLSLDEESRLTIEERLSDESVSRRTQELRRLVSTPQALAIKQILMFDPFGLADIFLNRVTSSRAGLAVDWASGYLLSKDHRMMLMLAKPVEPPQNVDFVKQLMAKVEEEIAAVQADWTELSAGEDLAPPEVSLGGRYVIAVSDDALIRRDVVVNVVTSMIGVLMLFLFAFRRFGLLLYAFVPLSFGLVLTFAFASLKYGTLSAATSGVAALLIGLGIDFVIVSYGRFVEERRAGRDLEESLVVMSGSSGRAVVVGGITSAATFYAFGVTDFVGLFQMGLLTGTGILFCMGAVLLLLPAMISWSDDHHKKRDREVRLYLHGLGSAHVVRASFRQPRLVLGLGLVVTVIAGLLAVKLEFRDSVQAMRPQGNPGVTVREEVADRFGLGFEQMMLLIEGESMAEVLEISARAADRAEELVAAGVLTGYDSVTSLMPPLSLQESNLQWLDEARQDQLNIDRIKTTFETQATAEGLRPEAFAAGLQLLAQATSRTEPLGLADFAQSVEAKSLLERYLLEVPTGWKAVVYLQPPPIIWRRQAPPEALQLAQELGPSVVLTGANVVSKFLRDRVLRDAMIAAVLGFALVALLLWFDFRSLRATMLSLAPLTMGLLWMLGGMSAMGESMNFMNIFVTTMIIGIGVDYGIHMLHRYRELENSPVEELREGLVQTGKAIVLAALSTTVGFGSLSLSHYPGLQSMGKVAILGALSTALVAITVLPAYLALRSGLSKGRQ